MGKPDTKQVHFYDEMDSKRDIESSSKIIFFIWDFNGHVGKCGNWKPCPMTFV